MGWIVLSLAISQGILTFLVLSHLWEHAKVAAMTKATLAGLGPRAVVSEAEQEVRTP